MFASRSLPHHPSSPLHLFRLSVARWVSVWHGFARFGDGFVSVWGRFGVGFSLSRATSYLFKFPRYKTLCTSHPKSPLHPLVFFTPPARGQALCRSLQRSAIWKRYPDGGQNSRVRSCFRQFLRVSRERTGTARNSPRLDTMDACLYPGWMAGAVEFLTGSEFWVAKEIQCSVHCDDLHASRFCSC
jgi:hypothetical protein